MAIHPFSNGNGRTGRLVTYFMLLRLGFQVNGQVLNPTAVLCVNRDRYYTELGNADEGHDGGLLSWCSFFAAGIRDESPIHQSLSGRRVRSRQTPAALHRGCVQAGAH